MEAEPGACCPQSLTTWEWGHLAGPEDSAMVPRAGVRSWSMACLRRRADTSVPASRRQRGDRPYLRRKDERDGETRTHSEPHSCSLAVTRASHRGSGVCKYGLVDELESSVELVPTLSLSLHTHTHTHTPHTHAHTRTYMHAHTRKLPRVPSRVPGWPRH